MDVVGATIKVVLQNLVSSPLEEISLLNFNKDLHKLKQSVRMIQDFLEDAEMRQDKEKAVRRWLMKLEAVAFDADYVFDRLNYEVLRKKVEKDHKMMKKVSSSFPFKTIARKIKIINRELKLINQMAMKLGLGMGIAHACGVGTDTPTYHETDSFSVYVGREDDIARIVKMLTTATQQLLSVLPIVGMGGVGKTTLTKKVYSDANIISHFRKRIWVRVSENDFDPMTVLKRVVASLTGENIDGSNEVVLQKLQKSLADEKYLLVLDNVGYVNNDKWDNFLSSLKGISYVNGNVIVVITRIVNSATIVETLDIYELRGLSEQDCWFIIRAKAFRGEGIPSEFETIGANIAKRCRGVPLAAQVVGSLLWGKSKDDWVSIEKNWLSDIGGNDNIVSKILKLSFDNLSSPMKKCFAFCSIVPKGWRIEKNAIIQLWMAEGLLQTDEEENMEIVGNRVFNFFVQSSLLQVWGEDYFGNAEDFCMHDLVHDFALSILKPNSLDDKYEVRYVSRPHIDDSSPIPTKLAKFLRTLVFNGKISQNIFSNFKRLHTLIIFVADMNQLPIEITQLPIEIGELLCLRFLDISHTRIEYLPDSIGNLYHLQTLRTNYLYGRSFCLRKLPDTLKFLISLRHLYIPNIKLPPKVGELIFLQTLPYFQVGDEEGCGIMELGSLNNLKGVIEIHNLEKVRDREEAKSANLVHKPNIVKLKLVWNESREDDSNDENVLDGLQPHWNLKSLEITGFKGKSFPQWTLRMEVRENLEDRWIRLDNLLEIRLSYCRECEEIPMLGHLPRLKSLYLCHLSNVKSMGSSFYGVKENEVTTVVFPALEKLELIDITNLFTWTEVELSSSSETQSHEHEVLVFGRLEYLKITNCRQLVSAPSHFPCLKELEIYNMESGLPLASICGSKLTTLEKLKICEVDGLVCLPDGLFNNNPGLLELDISDCNNLMHLVPWLGGDGASLEKLRIVNCWNFQELSKDIHSLKALKELRISNFPNLKSISYPSGKEFERVAATHVEELGSEPISSSKIMPGTEILREEFPDMLDMGISKISRADSDCLSISEYESEQQFADEVAEEGIVPEDSQTMKSNMLISLSSFDSEQRVESESHGKIQVVDEATPVADAEFSGEQLGTEPFSFQEKGQYMIVVENNHLHLKLDTRIFRLEIIHYQHHLKVSQ